MPPPAEELLTAPVASADGRATLRLCRIPRPPAGSCGFHISRTQWDPYPWISAVEVGSVAEGAGLRAGDCVLEVNGEDVLGQRIGEVAAKVRAKGDTVLLLVWNAGSDPQTAVTLTAGSGPTPLSLQLLSSTLQQVAALLECPVCLDTVMPPAWQCCHGHLLCSGCRARAERCPVCRVPLGSRGRCLLADKVHGLLAQTYQRYSDQRTGKPIPFGQRPPLGRPPEDVLEPASPSDSPTLTCDTRPRVSTRTGVVRLSSSNEDVCARVPPLEEPEEPPTTRTRSQSAGDIRPPTTSSPCTTCPDDVVHCPYGSTCLTMCPASEVFAHLRQDHDGPLLQYFPREGKELTVPLGRSRDPQAPQTITVLTTKSGDSVFLHQEQGRLWLWMLPSPKDDTTSSLRLDVLLPEAADKKKSAPVFSLSSSSEDVIASGRCLQVPDHDAKLKVTLTAAH